MQLISEKKIQEDGQVIGKLAAIKEVAWLEVMSRKTYIETGKSSPKLFMTADQLSEYEGMSGAHYRSIIREIEKQIEEGRYPETSIGGNPRSVNYYVYRDYMTNRRRLRNRNLKKTVKPFNPAEIAQICPLVREVVVMG